MRWRWLLVLPVAVALALVASASRLQVFWWPYELHEVTTGGQGEAVEVVDDWRDDDGGDHTRELTLTLVDVVAATEVEGYSGMETLHPAPGMAVWEIVLQFEVDPDVPLAGCRVSLVDDQGRESDASGGTVGEVLLPFTSCTPDGATGPLYDGSVDEEEVPRPPAYEMSVYAVTAASVVPEKVRLWWEAPDVVELSLAGS